MIKESIEELCEQLEACDQRHNLGYAVPSIRVERFVLDNGHEFRSQIRPKKYKKGRRRQCYYNAYWLASGNRQTLTYCEGFATPESMPFPIRHAWCIDRQCKIIDTTWTHPEQCQYFGVAFPWHLVSLYPLALPDPDHKYIRYDGYGGILYAPHVRADAGKFLSETSAKPLWLEEWLCVEVQLSVAVGQQAGALPACCPTTSTNNN